MNQRQKKKLIPKGTDYCYKVVERYGGELHTIQCPHYKIIGEVDDAIVDAGGEMHPCKSSVSYCSYVKVSSEEDVLLDERVKTCGERLPIYEF